MVEYNKIPSGRSTQRRIQEKYVDMAQYNSKSNFTRNGRPRPASLRGLVVIFFVPWLEPGCIYLMN